MQLALIPPAHTIALVKMGSMEMEHTVKSTFAQTMSNLIVREMKLVKENQIIHSNVYVIKDCKNREDLALTSMSVLYLEPAMKMLPV